MGDRLDRVGTQRQQSRRGRRRILAAAGAGAILVAGAIIFLAYWLVAGVGIGPRSVPQAIVNLVKAVSDRQTVRFDSTGDYRNIVFLHQSTGGNLIEQGEVRQSLAAAGLRFWDHGYNEQGIRDPSGRPFGYGYNVPRDRTDPAGLAQIFLQPYFDLPVNTFSGLLQHEVIIFKSCFAPTNHITSDQQLQNYQAWYLQIRGVIDRHPDKLFIVVTTPPLNPAETNRDEASRARQFANWLRSADFLGERSNIRTFDLFDNLAEAGPVHPEANMLRDRFRNGADSHPNRVANETIGPVFVKFVIDSIEQYRALRS